MKNWRSMFILVVAALLMSGCATTLSVGGPFEAVFAGTEAIVTNNVPCSYMLCPIAFPGDASRMAEAARLERRAFRADSEARRTELLRRADDLREEIIGTPMIETGQSCSFFVRPFNGGGFRQEMLFKFYADPLRKRYLGVSEESFYASDRRRRSEVVVISSIQQPAVAEVLEYARCP